MHSQLQDEIVNPFPVLYLITTGEYYIDSRANPRDKRKIKIQQTAKAKLLLRSFFINILKAWCFYQLLMHDRIS